MKKQIVAIVFASLPLFAQTPPCDQHSITVSGSGAVKVVPDRVSFTVGVLTTAVTVREAFNENNAKTQRVVASLKEQGVKDSEIQTSNFSINSVYDNNTRKPSGYSVSNSVTVTREDPNGVSDLIQVAVDAGANQANGVRFFSSKPSASRDDAMSAAVRDARAQAEKLAAATGSTLGRVININTYSYEGSQIGYMQEITVTASAPAIEAGTNNLSYRVTITYELK